MKNIAFEDFLDCGTVNTNEMLDHSMSCEINNNFGKFSYQCHLSDGFWITQQEANAQKILG